MFAQFVNWVGGRKLPAIIQLSGNWGYGVEIIQNNYVSILARDTEASLLSFQLLQLKTGLLLVYVLNSRFTEVRDGHKEQKQGSDNTNNYDNNNF